MAKFELHAQAVQMRLKGMSYSQIKRELKVSKSTLSLWLREYPLSEECLRQLRDFSEVRIEKYRETRRRTREHRLESVLHKASRDIDAMSRRDLFIAGLFLYWGEGSKTTQGTTSLSNTDPAVIRFFITWLISLGVPRERLRVHLHLYSDMHIKSELKYWAQTLGLPKSAFRKPYVKNSTRTGLTYPQKFTHGTCNIIYENRDTFEYVLAGLKCIRSQFAADTEL